MKIKQRIIKLMMKGLPPEEQGLMVTEFFEWLFADFTPAERRQKIAFWTPKLLAEMYSGTHGFWLLIYHYPKYLVSMRWWKYWLNPTAPSREDHFTQ
jgi:hypothetical protein